MEEAGIVPQAILDAATSAREELIPKKKPEEVPASI